ncbi:hypothetical protein [Bacillus bingmayongensis]|nr:hypothetical protein [Bacillus bingmayongensis]
MKQKKSKYSEIIDMPKGFNAIPVHECILQETYPKCRLYVK